MIKEHKDTSGVTQQAENCIGYLQSANTSRVLKTIDSMSVLLMQPGSLSEESTAELFVGIKDASRLFTMESVLEEKGSEIVEFLNSALTVITLSSSENASTVQFVVPHYFDLLCGIHS